MKIICIGRNYRAHIRELDGERPVPSEPQFFMKPDTALLRNNEPFYLPDFSNRTDYETELVVKINRVGKYVDKRFAHRYYTEVGLGIDFTARDLQQRAIAEGLPWEMCKSFDHSAGISPEFIPLTDIGGDIQNLHFEMSLNGEPRQQGWTGDMIFTVDDIIAHVSRFVTLRIGDLIYTGTPSGIGQLHSGDRLEASLEGHKLFDFDIR